MILRNFLFFPIERTFFDDVNEASEEEPHEHQHSLESIPSQSTEINRIRIEEYHFNIKQHKKYSYQEVFDGHWLAGITKLFDTTFKHLKLITCKAFRSCYVRQTNHCCNKKDGKNNLNANGKVVRRGIEFQGLTDSGRL